MLYEEGLNEQKISTSVNALANADLVAIVGTSMRVYPFAGLLDYRNPSAKVVVINQEALQFPFDFTMIQEDASQFFQELEV